MEEKNLLEDQPTAYAPKNSETSASATSAATLASHNRTVSQASASLLDN